MLTGLAAFVGATYVLVVVVGGTLTGGSGSPSTLLSVVATALVAVGIEPVRRRLRAGANRVLGRSPVPYDVLAHFASDGGTPARMARLLAEGVGAARAQVWLLAGGRMRLAGVHPEPDGEEPAAPDLAGEPAAGSHVRPVRHGGELLGMLVVEERAGEPLTPVERELLGNLAAQAGLVLRNLRLTAELQDRLVEVSARADALRESRSRVVASEDRERRRLERDIHDGAQQQLVALAVNLRLARTLLPRRPAEARELLGSLDRSVEQAVADLLDVVGGHPRLLADAGLTAALRAAADASPVPVEVTSRGVGRYSAEVEHAVYFCCLEALQNVAKHAAAGRVVIALDDDGRRVSASVRDDGCGFGATASSDGGLVHMVERIEAVGGGVTIRSVPGGGTAVSASVPIGAMAGLS